MVVRSVEHCLAAAAWSAGVGVVPATAEAVTARIASASTKISFRKGGSSFMVRKAVINKKIPCK